MLTADWKPAILVNRNAGARRGASRYGKIRDHVLQLLPVGTRERFTGNAGELQDHLRELIADGCNCFISAGGDGSVNALLNALLGGGIKLNGKRIAIGAIALGSSNDFCKPVLHTILDTPVRLGVNGTSLQDVGCIRFKDEKGIWQTTYFIVNASVGVTAEANLLFNQKDFFLSITKERFVNLAIVYAAVRTILAYKNIPISMRFDQREYVGKTANVAILKNPNVSGSFRYDQQILPQDGFLGLNYCGDISRFQLLKTLIGLGRGEFIRRGSGSSEFVKNITIHSEVPIALETDGEVRLTEAMNFSVLPSSIHVLN